MILQQAPTNLELSNVGPVGEFRIRNSAKAFKILSDGLYSNKHRAIVRELACNAVDSHVAAGIASTPIECHLPTALDPWFSIRDYGVGLNDDQVTNIYTTYFESTKTASNDFIGALGLGSKSPFSYTENFTVTAIKDGVQRIYTAFINELGVPSIAKMAEMETDQGNGVEVKFAVNHKDFSVFASEAMDVFSWFKVHPRMTGNVLPQRVRKFSRTDVIPGVHIVENSRMGAVAIMGNIAYPITIPQETLRQLPDTEDIRVVLNSPVVMEFAIGELDFQASREALSYIQSTIDAIVARCRLLFGTIRAQIEPELDSIENLWTRADKIRSLQGSAGSKMYEQVLESYIAQRGMSALMSMYHHYGKQPTNALPNKLKVDDLRAQYNVGITLMRAGYTVDVVHADRDYNNAGTAALTYTFDFSENQVFVTNDTKTGGQTRLKAYFKTHRKHRIWLLQAVDPKKPADYDGVLKLFHSPPESMVTKLSSYPATNKPKSLDVKGILEMHQCTDYKREGQMVWRDIESKDIADTTVTRYYVPLTGYEPSFAIKKLAELASPVHWLVERLKKSGIAELHGIRVFGVRKNRIEEIQKLPNWKLLEDHLTDFFVNATPRTFANLGATIIDSHSSLRRNKNAAAHLDASSPFVQLINEFKDASTQGEVRDDAVQLLKLFAPKSNLGDLTTQINDRCEAMKKRYPLLARLEIYVPSREVADYIKLVDERT